MYQPCAHDTNMESSKKCDIALCIWPQVTDYFVFAFFTIEMCIKMTAMGIFGKGTYLDESWNRLDCFIVLSELVELLIPGDNLNLSAIRTVRVLRPLRAIKRVPSVCILVMLLLDTLHNYALFDDFSLQSFYIPPDQDSFICSDPSSSEMTKYSEILQSRRDNMICELDFHSLTLLLTNKTINRCINWNQYYQLCTISNKNPFSALINFDNIISAWLAIFQVTTPNALSSPNVNIVSSTSLISQKHRSNCQYHQSQSLLVSTPLSKSVDRDTDTYDICLSTNEPTKQTH
ncbi:unnamed protein product [Rotaria sordida]|uniref:Ion transport domain-containing protein n=1 Tax=Rotaria sordida TaxID=392033 RepID=A0A815P4T7_9BILA|nr:unnamed protein product [Rotaria sordida]CAF3948982.1 unnamed protein product [Rotaria sordida]